jgi:hypothetical protein
MYHIGAAQIDVGVEVATIFAKMSRCVGFYRSEVAFRAVVSAETYLTQSRKGEEDRKMGDKSGLVAAF